MAVNPGSAVRSNSRRKLVLVLLVCIAPVIASYLAYYVFPPSDRTNYGALIEPQRPIPALDLMPVRSSAPGDLAQFRGRWVLVVVDAGACELACAEKLFFMRQTHASLGRERERVAQVLLVTDTTPLPQRILDAHPELTVLRGDQSRLLPLFPVNDGTGLADHIFVIDPLQNLMMRFPEKPEPPKVRKDLQKLLKASRIG